MKLANSSKVIDFALKSALCACFLLTVSAGALAVEQPSATPVSSQQALAADEAFVLVKMRKTGTSGTRTSTLSLAANNQLKLSINRDADMQLLKVKAGVYRPLVASGNNGKGIVIAPGTVTYIGDWHLYSNQKFMINGKRYTTSKVGYRVDFDIDNLFSFADDNSWIKQYPLHISHMNGKRAANNWTRAES